MLILMFLSASWSGVLDFTLVLNLIFGLVLDLVILLLPISYSISDMPLVHSKHSALLSHISHISNYVDDF